MLYTIEGKVKNIAVVHEYVLRLIKELNIDRLKRELDIEFVNSLEDEDIWGYCWGDEENVYIQIHKHDGTRKFAFLEMMQTLTHEMVHAKQYLRGELKLVNSNRVWKDSDGEHFSYETAPWEIEARTLEKELFLKVFPFDKSFKN
jgi:hypothetical protein